jgi:hypothetical protein
MLIKKRSLLSEGESFEFHIQESGLLGGHHSRYDPAFQRFQQATPKYIK